VNCRFTFKKTAGQIFQSALKKLVYLAGTSSHELVELVEKVSARPQRKCFDFK
jgi:hypothetical protein